MVQRIHCMLRQPVNTLTPPHVGQTVGPSAKCCRPVAPLARDKRRKDCRCTQKWVSQDLNESRIVVDLGNWAQDGLLVRSPKKYQVRPQEAFKNRWFHPGTGLWLSLRPKNIWQKKGGSLHIKISAERIPASTCKRLVCLSSNIL